MGPYACFLSRFVEEYRNYDEVISQLCADNKLLWNPGNPISAIHEFFRLYSNNNSSNVSSSQQTMSISSSFFNHNSEHDDSLMMKFEVLVHKYQETQSKDKHKEYLIKAACRLVRYAVEFQKENEDEVGSQMKKRSKSQSLIFFPLQVSPVDNQEGGPDFATPIARPSDQQLPLLGCFYYIKQIIEITGNDISLLNNFRYYPHPIPVADYHSTQSSQLSGLSS